MPLRVDKIGAILKPRFGSTVFLFYQADVAECCPFDKVERIS
jgi:hypothetical protein